MPRLQGGPRAQRVRYPNGTTSTPFMCPMPKADIVRIATVLLDGNGWREREEAAGYHPLSSRLACAYEGRFWSAITVWMRNVSDYSSVYEPRPSDRLAMTEMMLLLGRSDEFGWAAIRDRQDRVGDLARTILFWSESIEEWEAE